jgi:hypothetical protein
MLKGQKRKVDEKRTKGAMLPVGGDRVGSWHKVVLSGKRDYMVA